MTNFTEIYNEYKPQIEKLNKQFKKLQKHTKLRTLKILWQITNFKILYSDFKRSLGY